MFSSLNYYSERYVYGNQLALNIGWISDVVDGIFPTFRVMYTSQYHITMQNLIIFCVGTDINEHVRHISIIHINNYLYPHF